MGTQQSHCSIIPPNQPLTNKQNYQSKTTIITSIKYTETITKTSKLSQNQSPPSWSSNRKSSGSKKCQFVYVKPIKLYETIENYHTNQMTLSQQKERKQMVKDEIIEQQNQFSKNLSINKNLCKSIRVHDYRDNEIQKISLEQSQCGGENKGNMDRIFVQWSSFIKIKKKNYLDDYIHIKEIGFGAFGIVSKIQMKYGGLYRAAKTIKMSMLTQKKIRKEKFISQIMIPMKTDHPNINKLFEVFEWKNEFVLIMELCEGGDLFSYIKSQKSFGENKVAEIMKQVLSGLVYLHKNNIVHRDLKPDNMLYDTQSKLLKIIDFGSAIQLASGKKLTSIVGTPYYIAPEVLAGQYNEKCDIWSCGVILYILLCGVPPYIGKNQEQIMNNIRTQNVNFSSPIWNKRSKESKKLVMQMLNKDYTERLSAFEVLNSEWFLNAANRLQNDDLGIETIKHLNNFHFQNKLKAVVYTYIASQLYSNKDKETLLRCFREIDKDGDGVIEKEELVNIFKAHQQKNQILIDIDKLIQKIDTNGSGQIDFTQFLVAASKQEQLLQRQRLENAFSYLDTDHSGYITAEEIRPFLDSSDKTAVEIRQIFEQVDTNGDGRISKKEFVALLLKKD